MTAPDWKSHNQNNYILFDGKHASRVLEVCNVRGRHIDMEHCLLSSASMNACQNTHGKFDIVLSESILLQLGEKELCEMPSPQSLYVQLQTKPMVFDWSHNNEDCNTTVEREYSDYRNVTKLIEKGKTHLLFFFPWDRQTCVWRAGEAWLQA